MRQILFKLLRLKFVFAIGMFGLASQLAAAASCPVLSFGAPSYFPSGLTTNGLATGDLNGDGKVDLVAANEASGTVTVRFGDGTGAFPSSIQFAVNFPSSVAVGDFNGDGHLDFATTSRAINRVTVRLGVGNGTFGAAVQTTVGSGPSGLVVGDFNRDGNIDLVTSNSGTNSVTFLPGNAAGSFPTAANFSVARGSGAAGVAAADFNGDGNLDLATSNRATANMSVLLGDGSGAFSAAAVYPASTQPSSIVASDFNGDGKPDLATANFGAASLTVRFNNGVGAFPTALTLPVGVQPLFLTAGDLDSDGDADLVATNRASNTLSIFASHRDGTFGPRIDIGISTGPRALLIGDLNQDGLQDIAAGTESGVIGVLLNGCSTNTAPMISAGAVIRQQDAGSSRSTVATVSDEQDDPGELVVTVAGGTSATVNGVTISNIGVDATGNVTADVAALCGASDAMFTLEVTDSEGLSATGLLGVDVTNETTPPIINMGAPLLDIAVYVLLNSPNVSMPVTFEMPAAMDNCTASPTVTSSPESGTIFNAGSTVVTVTAADELKNTSTATFRVNVLFNFGGFLQPVDPFPMLNVATAGSSIPIKFSLSGDKGLNILATGYPASSAIACDANEPSSTIEETTSNGGGLAYDAESDRYIYVWKTNKAWKRSCRILIVKLSDGSEHYAKFSFR